jgi:hypothetical protein
VASSASAADVRKIKQSRPTALAKDLFTLHLHRYRASMTADISTLHTTERVRCRRSFCVAPVQRFSAVDTAKRPSALADGQPCRINALALMLGNKRWGKSQASRRSDAKGRRLESREMHEAGLADWQPMESAPRNGSRVLVAIRATEQGPAEVDVVRWTNASGSNEHCWVAIDSDPGCVIMYSDTELAGWMPLPTMVPTLRSTGARVRQSAPAVRGSDKEQDGSGI